MGNQKRSGGKMRPLWTLAGGYLLYLAYQQIGLCLRGEAETRGQVVICVASAVVFAAVGAWVLWREWTYAHSADADAVEDSEASPDTDTVTNPDADTVEDSEASPDTDAVAGQETKNT